MRPGENTAAGRVLALLREWDGWVCARLVNSPEIAGWRGSARVADLRRSGYVIESDDCGPDRCDHCRRAATFQRARGRRPARVGRYRLRSVQARIPLHPASEPRQLGAP